MSNTVHQLPEDMAHLTGLRLNDLVAKIARVTLKDTTRVLLAADTVADFLGVSVDDILSNRFSVDRPTSEESVLCNKSFAELEDYLVQEGEADWIRTIRAMD